MQTPHYWEEAKDYLSAKDEVLGRLISKYSGEGLSSRGDAFYTLARSIVGQQISVKAADSVWNKLENELKLQKLSLIPHEFASLSDESLRSCGLSRQKVLYMRNIAQYFIENGSRGDFLHELDDESAIKSLTTIKGVGRWTAEMFLIFHLLRADIFPVDDIGLIRAIEKYYYDGNNIDKKQAFIYRDNWGPYNTVATWYLWRALDPEPVEY
ncbi:MAG: DNA-3-methyladenine glycosylase [Rickettsiales bacterium]|nr:DNA-3-methyladenine glycosylase [Rickettsiales bacterium]